MGARRPRGVESVYWRARWVGGEWEKSWSHFWGCGIWKVEGRNTAEKWHRDKNSRAIVRENDSCVCGVCKGSCRVGLAPHLEMQGCGRGGTVTGSIGVKTGETAFAVY